jgi:hypothetical protein
MNAREQIKKLRGHVPIFSEHLRYLIQTFEVLLPMAENEALLNAFSNTKRARGFLVVRASLMQQCLIGITKLTYDTGPQNPTASKMIGVLLAPAAKPPRNRLKAEFAVPIKPPPPIDRPWSAEDEKMWEEEKKQETKEYCQAFDDQLGRIDAQWEWFSSHRRQFKNLRDTHLV